MASYFVIISGLIAIIAYLYSSSRPTAVKTLQPSYDYIVVGAGSSGSVLAARLSEEPNVTVLVLEAGGEETENWKFHVPFLMWDLQGTEADWSYPTEPQKHCQYAMKERRSLWPRGRVLGGSSILNGMVYMRGSHHDFDDWAKQGCEGWSYNDVLPYFLKSEDIRIGELKSSKYHSTGGPLKVTGNMHPPMDEVTIQAGKDMGLDIVDCNGYDMLGLCRDQATVDNGVRASTSRQFLRPAMGRPNLHVATHSLVSKVNIENERAVGVDVIRNGRKQKVVANKEVILTGGAVGSPQILLLSGIGPKQHLEEMKIPLIADLPVGEHLQDHLMAIIAASVNVSGGITPERIHSLWDRANYLLFGNGPLASNFGLEATVFFHVSDTEAPKTLPEIEFHVIASIYERFDIPDHFNYDDKFMPYFKVGKNAPARDGFQILINDLHPKSRGTIRLRSQNPFDYPIIQPNYLKHPDDIDTLLKGIRKAEEYFTTPAFQKIGADILPFPPCTEKHKFRSDEYWDCFMRHTAVTIYHPTSTCKMGPKKDQNAVVDPQLRVKGISGLRVADASVMPNVVSGNTNAACIMIAEKAADLIRGKDTVEQFKDRV